MHRGHLIAVIVSSLFLANQTLVESSMTRLVPSQSNNSPVNQESTTNQRDAERQDGVRIDTTLVSIPVTVTERGDRPVVDLKQSDFQIYDNGVEQQISFF